ncbi:MAG TPA: DUF938 domain-containing protein [Polyangiaceae bacterium]|nr:DUF938 domain-containing protein [Polyangiaceae bacterium]
MDDRLSSPSVARNRDPILEVLAPLCSARRAAQAADAREEPVRVLELASGSGEHAVHFATHLPLVTWQPSDLDLASLASIDAWRLEARATNILPPLRLDATDTWRLPAIGDGARFDGLVCINMLHISPWEATVGLFENAERALARGAFVLLYGPYRQGGRHTAESNARFDASLRVRDPRWGVRCLDDVTAVAAARGFTRERVVEMPRDNLCVTFRSTGERDERDERPRGATEG